MKFWWIWIMMTLVSSLVHALDPLERTNTLQIKPSNCDSGGIHCTEVKYTYPEIGGDTVLQRTIFRLLEVSNRLELEQKIQNEYSELAKSDSETNTGVNKDWGENENFSQKIKSLNLIWSNRHLAIFHSLDYFIGAGAPSARYFGSLYYVNRQTGTLYSGADIYKNPVASNAKLSSTKTRYPKDNMDLHMHFFPKSEGLFYLYDASFTDLGFLVPWGKLKPMLKPLFLKLLTDHS